MVLMTRFWHRGIILLLFVLQIATATVAREQVSPNNMLLVIFVHGFSGSSNSFGRFPQDLQRLLRNSSPTQTTECIVYPTYLTTGELSHAVRTFTTWLIRLVTEKENGQTGRAQIVLCGHSMGGLITADSLRDLARPYRNSPSMWPKVVACLSFDTPFFGTPLYQPYMALFSMGLQGYMTVTEPQARLMTGPVGPWESLFDTIQRGTSAGVAAAYPYLEFLQELQDDQALQKRVDDLISFRKHHGVQFTTLYVALPTTNDRRTFVKLPSSGLAAAFPFLPIQNGLAKDATEGHIGMFSPRTNDHYDELCRISANFIQRAL
ncbi:hypothetical protein JOM56_008084 [Amanita muscaria]